MGYSPSGQFLKGKKRWQEFGPLHKLEKYKQPLKKMDVSLLINLHHVLIALPQADRQISNSGLKGPPGTVAVRG